VWPWTPRNGFLKPQLCFLLLVIHSLCSIISASCSFIYPFPSKTKKFATSTVYYNARSRASVTLKKCFMIDE